MRRFVLISQTALASGQYALDDLASSSGRIDALLHCVRAALLVSNGLRRNVIVYLVLRGGEQAPRVLRIDGRSAKFLRPDERSLAVLVQKALATAQPAAERGQFAEVRPGLSLCAGDLDEVLADVGQVPRYLLDEQGQDVREQTVVSEDALFFIGDQLGFDARTLARLNELGCTRLSVGPVSLHSADVVTLLNGELDRLVARAK